MRARSQSRGRRVDLAIFFAALMLATSPAAGDKAKARLGRVMWSAFVCTTYAGMAEKEEEATRLFDAGLKAGRDFIDALKSGNISQEELHSTVPTGVTLLLNEPVPSADFLIGRVYAMAQSYAYDKIVKMDNSGLPLDVDHWVMDEKLQKIKAQSFYSKRNCELVRYPSAP
jgi:hypothetical protein